MRLRRKLTVAFFGVSSLLSVLLAVFLYRFVERQLGDDLRDRLRDITSIGSHLVDRPAYERLAAQLARQPGEPLDDARISAVEGSADYKQIYDRLQLIRQTEPDLIHFAYLLAPTANPDKPRFVVDADVLALRAKLARGEPLGDHEDISHFAQEYDVAGIPLLRRALTECTRQFEPDFVHDEQFGVSSVSAYIPLSDAEGRPLRDAAGRCLGVLGVDITDKNMRTALDSAGSLAIKVSIAMIALALLVSIAMGTVLTRSILALSRTVRRFADKDFSARVATRAAGSDEIGQLGRNFNAMAETIQIHSEQLEDLVAQRTKELSAEKHTSERLLLNVLPGPIADRLRTGESLIVDRFEAVSVLFADIVGFTAMAQRTTPEALVTMLNEVFSAFDELAEQHGLEKIKTIGDAYMVVAGIPSPLADHAIAIAHMALDMLASVEAYGSRHGTPMSIRVGIHTGSVVAGVIGTKKFIYDLWGDTVNTASRMESTGVPGKVQVTEVTYQLLKDQFELESRGPIEIKGKGAMATYLLGAQRADPTRVSIKAIVGLHAPERTVRACSPAPRRLLRGPAATRLVALAGRRALLGRRRSARRGAAGLRPSATAARRLLVLGLAVASAARLLAPAVLGVDRGPGARRGLLGRHALLLVGVLDMLGLPFLLVGVPTFISAWHRIPPR
ncbi:MAG: adenylate/guanylate cyclase domain-containing protein [Kofleriaceae bacterium]